MKFFFHVLVLAFLTTACRAPETETVYVYVTDPDGSHEQPVIIFDSPRDDHVPSDETGDPCDPFQFNWIDGPYETTSQPIARTVQSSFFAQADGHAEQPLLFSAESGCGEGYFIENMLITIDAEWLDYEERGMVTVETPDGDLHDEELVVFIVEGIDMFIDKHASIEIVVEVSPELTENMIPENGELGIMQTMIQWTDAETGNAMHKIMENPDAWDDKGQTFSFLRALP